MGVRAMEAMTMGSVLADMAMLQGVGENDWRWAELSRNTGSVTRTAARRVQRCGAGAGVASLQAATGMPAAT